MLENLTPYAAVQFPSTTHTGEQLEVTCLAARFELPKPSAQPNPSVVRVSDVQRPPPLQDVYWSDPTTSSLRYEAQNTWTRRGIDVCVNGTAHAPRRKAVEQLTVTVSVGRTRSSILVFGDREWRGLGGSLVVGPARPFTSMPLTFERSFGGTARSQTGAVIAQEARNPVGTGCYASSEEARRRPLPNLELPGQRISRWNDRPAPAGFAALARSWQPRAGLAGTFDNAWVKSRAPLWPNDFDLRHLNAAAEGLVLSQLPHADEAVVLSGFAPDGIWRFMLPSQRFKLRSVRRNRADRSQALTCDAIVIEPDEGSVTLFYRASVAVEAKVSARDVDVLRELEPWEDDR